MQIGSVSVRMHTPTLCYTTTAMSCFSGKWTTVEVRLFIHWPPSRFTSSVEWFKPSKHKHASYLSYNWHSSSIPMDAVTCLPWRGSGTCFHRQQRSWARRWPSQRPGRWPLWVSLQCRWSGPSPASSAGWISEASACSGCCVPSWRAPEGNQS